MSEQNINITKDLEQGRKGRNDNLWLRIKKQNKLHHNVSRIKDLLVSEYAEVVNGFIIYLTQIPKLLTTHLLCQHLYISTSISSCCSIIYLYFWFLFFFCRHDVCRHDNLLAWISQCLLPINKDISYITSVQTLKLRN